MKMTKTVFLIAAFTSPAGLADQVGHGSDSYDPINGPDDCADCTPQEVESNDASLLDTLLELFTLDEDGVEAE